MKRAHDNDSKPWNKLSYNVWKKKETTVTPPESSTSSNNKHNSNLSNKCGHEMVTEPITISELIVGFCKNRKLIFRASFKSGKRGSKNGDMFVFHAMNGENEIQVTVFPRQTTKFFDVIKLNCTYELINFNVKKESEDFPLFVGEGIYLCLLDDSQIEEVDNNLVPGLRFNFVNVEAINLLNAGSKCDCMAVIARNWGQETVGQNKLKRELCLTDKSKECITITLWGAEYTLFDHTATCVLIHNGVVKEYNGMKTISCSPQTLFWHEPDIEGANELKLWFKKECDELQSDE